MSLSYLTWVRVAQDTSVVPAAIKEQTADLDALLTEHVANLTKRVTRGGTPPASFVTGDDRDRFEAIRTGPRAAFLGAVDAIAARVIERMDGRTSPGLLVLFRLRTAAGDSIGAVLKLEVTESYAGFLREEPSGDEVLDAVRNLLDTPGQLQKGAIVPDARSTSEVIVGDKLADTSLYFLDALGIRKVERQTSAVATVVSVASDVAGPEGALAIAQALQEIRPRSVDELLTQVERISPDQREQIRNRLQLQRRPVRELAPDRAGNLRQELIASGITVAGRLADIRERVRIEPQPNGRWRITILVDEEPRPSFR